MDATVVLLILLHSFRGTELLGSSEQPTNSSLVIDNVSKLISNTTGGITPHNPTNDTMNNTETGLDTTGSNETSTSSENMSDDGTTHASTNNTDLNVTDTKDVDTNNTNASENETGSGSNDVGSGETTPSPGTNITQSNNPEDTTTFTRIATTNDINSSNTTTSSANTTTSSSANTTTSSANTTTISSANTTTTTTSSANTTTTSSANTTTTSANSSSTLKGLDGRRDTASNMAVDSAGSNTRNSNSTAWAIVIGTALAVGGVSLIVYIWKRRRGHRDFNHRKLVEDLPRGPVLRLDSYENLGMGTLSFDNPVLQSDDIYMDYMGAEPALEL